MASLDGKRIRIKGTDITTTVRYCSRRDDGTLIAVTELWYHPEDPDIPENVRTLMSDDNPYGDECTLDQIELWRPGHGWYTPTFKAAA